jgi:hypothetical protein
MHVEQFYGQIWEPAVGNGAMLDVLRKYTNEPVIASDLHMRPTPIGAQYTQSVQYAQHDFLHTAPTYYVPNIITNPPFHSATQFLEQALHTATSKVALFLRLAFLESVARYELFQQHPPTTVHVFSERVSLYPANDYRETGGSTAYAWFVWNILAPTSSAELKWIPPGYKMKYGC